MLKIETSRLLLRTFSAEDLSDFYEYAKNPNVAINAGFSPHKDIQESQQILETFIACEKSFAIVLKQTGKVIGSFSLNDDKKRELINAKSISIGYSLSESYWGQGLMTEAISKVIDYVFTFTDTALIAIAHFPTNVRSQRVIEKCGFVYEGRLRSSFELSNGKIEDELCYSLYREEYFLNQLK